MSEQLGKAVLVLETDDKAFDAGMDRARRGSEQLADDLKATGSALRNTGKNLSLAVTAPIVAMAATSVNAFRQQEKAVAQLDAVLASMGDRAGFTSQQLQAMASELQNNSLFGDEDILNGVTNNLLTFGNIAGQEFSRAQQLAVDLSARFDQDLKSSAIQLGKALNDPAKGLAALGEVGVSFTEQQKEQIKAMSEAGDMAGAQASMLSVLEEQFAGQAKAAAEADGGITQLGMAWGDAQEQIGAVVMELLPMVVPAIRSVVDWIQNLDEGTRRWVVGIALAAAALGPLLVVLGLVASGVGMIIGPMGTLVSILKLLAPSIGLVGKALMVFAANPVFLAIAAAVAAVYLAWQNWDKIQPIIAGVGRVISNWWKSTVEPVFAAIGKAVEQVVQLWRDTFGKQFEAVIAGLRALMTGDFRGVWDAAKSFVTAPIVAILKSVEGLVPGATAAFRNLYLGAKQWLQDRLGAAIDWVADKLSWVGDMFKKLYVRVVGNSYIPDMVRGIGEWMAKLEEQMVKPAEKAAKKTGDVMQDAKDRVLAIMKELFPEIERFNQFEAKRKDIEASDLPAEMKAEALRRLWAGYYGEFDGLDVPELNIKPGDNGRVDPPSASGAPGSAEPPVQVGFDENSGQRLQQNAQRFFAAGIRAAIDGDLGGFLKNWLTRLGDSLINNLINGVASALASGLGQIVGGNSGLAGMLASIFAGGFHTGGMIPQGQFGIVGERGPEPVWATPRGALVRPNRVLSQGIAGPAAPNVVMPITIDATGADAAALGRVKASLDELKRDMPGIVVGTVNDAGERGMLGIRGWRN